MHDQLDKFHEFDLAGNMQKLDEMNKQTIIYEQINIALKTTALLNEKQYFVFKVANNGRDLIKKELKTAIDAKLLVAADLVPLLYEAVLLLQPQEPISKMKLVYASCISDLSSTLKDIRKYATEYLILYTNSLGR
jgi:hypothetical protein